MVYSTPQRDMKGERNNVILRPKADTRLSEKIEGYSAELSPEYSTHCPLGRHASQGYLIRKYHDQKATLQCDQLHLLSSVILSYGSDYVFFLARKEATGEGGRGGGFSFRRI
jgi:hypothetical protein